MKRQILAWLLAATSSVVAQQDQNQEIEVTGTASANVTWDSVDGRSYFLQYSTDLVNWNYFPLIEYGDGTPQFSYGFEANGSKVFSRLHYIDAPFIGNVEDADFDKDGISNWNEIKTGGSNTKPFEYSSAGDGISDYQLDRDGNNLSDGWELEQGPNLGALDPNADDDDDGLSNFEESLLRTKADNPDTDGDDLLDGEDAVPTDGEIDWKRTPEYSYAWIEIEGAEDKEGPMAVNKHGQVVFGKGVWYAGEWLTLVNQGNATIKRKWYGGEIEGIELNAAFDYLIDVSDEGVIVGSTSLVWPVYSAGMLWTPQANSLTEYGAPQYFIAAEEVEAPEEGAYGIGRMSADSYVPLIGADNDFSGWRHTALHGYFMGAATYSSVELSILPNDYYGGEAVASADSHKILFWQLNDQQAHLKLYDQGEVSEINLSENYAQKYNRQSDFDLSVVPKLEANTPDRLWVAADKQVFIEKKTVIEGQDRWHHPLSLAEGAKRVNSKGEAITKDKVWRNGKYHSLEERLKEIKIGSTVENFEAIDLASNGLILAQVKIGGVYKVGLLLPVELITDLNNDGKIDSADNPLRDAALESGATDEVKDKGTEFLFYNDQLSNGLWDKEDSDPDKPADEKDDDDAQEIKIVPGITEGEVWLEHPAIAGLSFYKTRECNVGDKVNLSPDNKFSVSSSNPFPDQLFVRADGQLNFPADNPQIEGDLVLKIKVGGANGQEIEALKMKFTVVKEFGAKKFFDTVDDYIRENNTKLCVVRKTYGADVFRMVFMIEGYTRMFPIDASRRPGGGQLKGIGAVIAAYPSTVTINGNQCFFIDERNPYLAGLSGDITDRCHGRVVRSGGLDPLVSSDAHLPAHGSPFSPLAGPEPMPDGSRGGNYFIEKAAGNYGIGASVLPSSSTNNAANPASGMGGLSANFNRRQSDGNAVQSIGYYNKTGVETEGIIFTASTEILGEGKAKDLADDAKKSGVKGLSGGRAGESELLFLDGSTSVALAYSKGGAEIKTVIEGNKHKGPPYYYINTYLIFQSWPTR